ncbi:MAG: hypothetical protein M1823_003586 [Watsoniomyces obsoletus]|nr:MAG: hypothetical protein M1823_003586 [Watsoniomyces obsoletus]
MPFIPCTPEALVSRSDSKDPATTCRGITSAGRACRRNLAASSRSRTSQVSTSIAGKHGIYIGAAALFCWQHRDQADSIEEEQLRRPQQLDRVRIKQKTSIDTLIDRLGVIEIAENPPRHPHNERVVKDWKSQASHGHKKDNEGLPSSSEKYGPSAPRPRKQKRGQKAHRGFLSFLCCGPLDDDPIESVPGPRKRTTHQGKTDRPSISEKHSRHPTGRNSKHTIPGGKNPSKEQPAQSVSSPKTRQSPYRSHMPRDPPSQTQTLLSIIPTHLSPQTVSSLLAELAKPFPAGDEEGYIYIFSLRDPTSQQGSFPSIHTPITPPASPNQTSILLKIGRTSNVHRRLNEWTQQCGYELNLIRFYPHVTSTPSPPQSSGKEEEETSPFTKKVQHVRRVERLIHLELASQRVKNPCRACGSMHQEWFAVRPDVEGLRAVNETVRRWVRWAENV